MVLRKKKNPRTGIVINCLKLIVNRRYTDESKGKPRGFKYLQLRIMGTRTMGRGAECAMSSVAYTPRVTVYVFVLLYIPRPAEAHWETEGRGNIHVALS